MNIKVHISTCICNLLLFQFQNFYTVVNFLVVEVEEAGNFNDNALILILNVSQLQRMCSMPQIY